MPDRGSIFWKNARLAIAVGRHLMGKDLTDARIVDALTGLDLPGRFEAARRTPPIVLDGAHNPSGAVALAGDLGRMSKRWTFVVGVNSGHDAGGILEAIQPLAEKFGFDEVRSPQSPGRRQAPPMPARGAFRLLRAGTSWKRWGVRGCGREIPSVSWDPCISSAGRGKALGLPCERGRIRGRSAPRESGVPRESLRKPGSSD